MRQFYRVLMFGLAAALMGVAGGRFRVAATQASEPGETLRVYEGAAVCEAMMRRANAVDTARGRSPLLRSMAYALQPHRGSMCFAPAAPTRPVTSFANAMSIDEAIEALQSCATSSVARSDEEIDDVRVLGTMLLVSGSPRVHQQVRRNFDQFARMICSSE